MIILWLWWIFLQATDRSDIMYLIYSTLCFSLVWLPLIFDSMRVLVCFPKTVSKLASQILDLCEGGSGNDAICSVTSCKPVSSYWKTVGLFQNVLELGLSGLTAESLCDKTFNLWTNPEHNCNRILILKDITMFLVFSGVSVTK